MRCRSCAPIPEEVRAVADLLERRATVSVIFAANQGAVRFNEFLQMLGRVPPATLASRLSDLERAGMLRRDVLDARPPRVEYRLTISGRRLGKLIAELHSFALGEAPAAAVAPEAGARPQLEPRS